MEETHSGIGDTIEEIDTPVKENVKSTKEILTQNIQKICNVMKIENLRTKRREEGYFLSQNTTKYLPQNHRRKFP